MYRLSSAIQASDSSQKLMTNPQSEDVRNYRLSDFE